MCNPSFFFPRVKGVRTRAAREGECQAAASTALSPIPFLHTSYPSLGHLPATLPMQNAQPVAQQPQRGTSASGGAPPLGKDAHSNRVDVINTKGGRILCVADVRGECEGARSWTGVWTW